MSICSRLSAIGRCASHTTTGNWRSFHHYRNTRWPRWPSEISSRRLWKSLTGRAHLAVEIDVTSRSIPRLPIYAALGVPEICKYDGRQIQCLILDEDDYRRSEFSLAFPKLCVSELLPFIRIAEEKSD